jgi:adenine-specific DNA methylase
MSQSGLQESRHIEHVAPGSETQAAAPGWYRPAADPFRPVQFLGSKARVLDALTDALHTMAPGRGRVLDLFSGSSIVAQSIARTGRLVTAVDALEHCGCFARALLGVGAGGECDSEVVDAAAVAVQADDPWVGAWDEWVAGEVMATSERDSHRLITISLGLPQWWRPHGASSALRRRFSRLEDGQGTAGAAVAACYAGTYFGIAQAVEIDRIRCGVRSLRASGAVGQWGEAVLLTALLSAASDCAFSAGKHYAQPHRIRMDKDLTFVYSRILQDRSKRITALFLERVGRVIAAARAAGEGHEAVAVTFEEFTSRRSRTFQAIYADPPYTAQQYSRFYHVPEVIFAGRVPTLQRRNGAVTRGLYPEGRLLSRFCSRRQAPAALNDICEFARRNGAVLFLSYSATKSGLTGNQRSISLSDLRQTLRHSFTHVEEHELPVTYRQFNASSSAVTGRNDVELLLLASGSRA